MKMGGKKLDMTAWIRFIWLRREKGVGSCEHGSEPSGYKVGRVFLESLRNY
jgi:hypothetical protein